MGLIDFKALMRKVALSRKKAKQRPKDEKPEPAKPKKKEKKKSKRGRKKKQPPLALKKDEDQIICKREGCYNEGPFSYGLCLSCYDTLRSMPIDPESRVSIKAPISVDTRVAEGDKVLISNTHNNHQYRGLYGDVTRLEDENTIALIEFDGESIYMLTPKEAQALRGRQVYITVEHLLPVEP